MSLVSQVEAILFVAGKPLSAVELARSLNCSKEDIVGALASIKKKFNQENCGIQLADTGESMQMITNPDCSEVVEKFTTDEIMGELTRAQLETLTVIAYQSPVTRPELEAIRGVNCAIILRNLELRGLVQEGEEQEKLLPVYRLTVSAMRHLGIRSPEELPEYNDLHRHPHVETALSELE